MESEIEVSRRFLIRLNEEELRELMSWRENREEDKPTELGDRLYNQLTTLRDGTPLNVESPPSIEPARFVTTGRDPNSPSPAMFDRLRQRSQQGNPVLGGEWTEHD